MEPDVPKPERLWPQHSTDQHREKRRGNSVDTAESSDQHCDKMRKTANASAVPETEQNQPIDLLRYAAQIGSRDISSTTDMPSTSTQAGYTTSDSLTKEDCEMMLQLSQDAHKFSEKFEHKAKQLKLKLEAENDCSQPLRLESPILQAASQMPSTACYEEELNTARHETAEAQRQLRQKDEEIQRLRAELLAAYDKGEMNLQANNSSITRDDIEKQYEVLTNEIENLVRLKFSGHPFKLPTLKQQTELFLRLVPEERLKLYLKDPTLKALLLKSAIWHEIIGSFLASPSGCFQELTGKAMTGIQRMVLGQPCTSFGLKGLALKMQGPDLEDVSLDQWRAFQSYRGYAGQYLQKVFRENESFQERDSTNSVHAPCLFRMVDLFSRYSATPNEDELRSQFRGVIHQALALASMIGRCKDHYIVCMPTVHRFDKVPEGMTRELLRSRLSKMDLEILEPCDWKVLTRHHGLTMRESYMEVIMDDDKNTTNKISLSVSPALIRYIDNIQTFKKGEVVVKAKVFA